ncbi:TlpA family protein disulfide reductase [Chryseobacterium taklimakanense]|uniref:TlpA family protein disulfide reductase n=1 Tax=Chryseobacterium taklimakanense TaxID=536441 RepID=UPI001EF61138|nr:TlpA disulfide reductase family protein [Chryseobacterium taklimakanense]MCG7281153.1 TlpA family protein disulfide reductase [Chryseobacterium taklimakanense]
MKKNTLRILAVGIPLILIGLMIYLFINLQNKKSKLEGLQHVPTFNLQTIDGKIFTNRDLEKDKNKILVYFSPGCHYCQAEVEELSKLYQNYPEIEWIWIASEPVNEIKKFAEQYKLQDIENIKWCHDNMATFYQQFALNSVPYFLIYDRQNNLVLRNKGAVKLEKIVGGLVQ